MLVVETIAKIRWAHSVQGKLWPPRSAGPEGLPARTHKRDGAAGARTHMPLRFSTTWTSRRATQRLDHLEDDGAP
jgi:hypothetical protein